MIALTGGAGFIGSVVLKKLNDEGIDDILVIDTLGTGEKWKNLVGKRFLSVIPKEEFRNGIKCGEYDGKIRLVLHLGACTKTTERDADYLMDNNHRYSIDLAEYCNRNGVRYIYASSAASYGLGEFGYDDTVFSPLRPLNMYGYSKHVFDEWMIQTGSLSNSVGLKFFNVFGPNEYHKADMASMVFKSWRQITTSGHVKLFRSTSPQYSDGGQMRDFVYVKDAVEVIWKLINSTGISGIYNLGTGIARSWNDLVLSVFSAMGKDVSIEYIDMPALLEQQYQNFTEADMTRLNATAASHSFMRLEDSVVDYVQEYLLNNWKYV
ncbi:MAG: ADP-glyceromanno-heptose 6-epimerase [Candidatus Kapabacteria bacterium]|nr:ADP-glyceromanno-heptose 6-epimerase [Candidatus Kapabacteria bacterium]